MEEALRQVSTEEGVLRQVSTAKPHFPYKSSEGRDEQISFQL